MQKQKLPIYLLLGIFILLFSVSACKTDPKTGEEETPAAKATEVRTRLRAEPDKLNPMLTWRGWSIHVNKFIFPNLLEYDIKTYELAPVLVKSRPLIEPITEGKYQGGTRFTYELHDEAVWDNGSPMTGKDYEFAMKALFNPHVVAIVYRQYLDLIKDVELYPDNPKKFTVITDVQYIKAEYATGYFILPEYVYDPEGLMSTYTLADLRDPANAEAHKNDEKLKAFGDQFNSPDFSRKKENISGPGAYQLEEWVEGERIVLTKKKDWWGDKLREQYPKLTAYPEKLTFVPVDDPNTAITLLKDQAIDVMAMIPEAQFNEMKENELVTNNYNFHTPPLLGYAYAGFNTKSPKLNDKRVRRAIAHLYDVDKILESVKLGYAEATVGPFHPSKSYYHKGLKPIKLDIEKATALLEEAGWKDSNGNGTVDKMIQGKLTEMELDYLISTNNTLSSNIALIFQNDAKKAGVKLNIVEKEANVIAEDLSKRDFEIFARATGDDIVDDPKQFWHTESDTPRGSNRFGFGNAETDALIEKIRSTLDMEERTKLLLKFQEIVYDEQPAIFAYATLNRIAIHSRFKGVETSLVQPGYFENFWYE